MTTKNPISALLNRRKVLLGLASASTAAATASAADAKMQENPDLVALADSLPRVAEDHAAARAEVRRIVAEWSPHWPKPHRDLVRFGNGCRTYRAIDGRGIQHEELDRVVDLATPEYLENSRDYHAAEADRKSRTKSRRGMKFHAKIAEKDAALIEPARAYWAEVERVTEVRGIKPAQERSTVTREAFQDHVGAIMSLEDWTIAGAVIKAQAMNEWAQRGDPFYVKLNPHAQDWAISLSASIMRYASA